MTIRADEISDIIKKEIQGFDAEVREVNYGTVIQVGDNIATVYGLSEARAGEMLLFEKTGIYGIVFNLEENTIGSVIVGRDTEIKEGDRVVRTGKIVEVPVGPQLLGRVVNPLGEPADGKGPLNATATRPTEWVAPTVVERQPVGVPMATGLKAIDAMVPIGRGQRELIIGDRGTGKTAIAVDAILNQKGKDVICVYVSVGQKTNNVAAIAEILAKAGAMEYTIIVTANANEPASLLYLAPYAGCAMGEYFMYTEKKDVLIIYDDLTKHAKAYREMSLLLRRPPGREAYPGDVFFLHSRLLERAARLSDEEGGGSMTALPIIETQLGDVSAYIPTNVISITDGQIFLDNDLFYQGIRPAVDVGLSVSRVGGAAQVKAMKQVAGQLRLDLAQFRELAAFTKFSADELDKASRDQLRRGERVVQALVQKQFQPLPNEEEVAFIFAAVNGYLDELPVTSVSRFEERYLTRLRADGADILASIREKKAIDDETLGKLKSFLEAFVKSFAAEQQATRA
ncbi:MAG: F0F1 ATP synthase subunit alpha [Proteobacteria bacterium]|nr:F0F1 ATP synthase subunit alpha [Pseudomonadota bacterium]